MGVSLYLVFNKKFFRPTKLKRTIALAFVFLIYLFLGAYTFQRLNLPIELEERQQILEYKKWFLNNHKCLDETNLNDLISTIEDGLSSGIIFVENSKEFTSNWSFGGETIFFVFTTLATIGYGQIAPLTHYGKLFCIFYIIMGVPLTMIIITLIVDKLEYELTKNSSKNRLLNYLEQKRYRIVPRDYSSINSEDEFKYFSNEKYIYKQTFKVVLFVAIFIFLIPSYIFNNYTEPKWSFLDALYYCYISATTVGFGDLVAGETQEGQVRGNYRLVITFYLIVAVISNMLFLNMLLQLPLLTKIHNSWLKLKRRKLFKYGSNFDNDQNYIDSENSSSIFPNDTGNIDILSDDLEEGKLNINRTIQNRSGFFIPKTKIV